MSYRQRTSHYSIPVLGYGDTIEPSTELSKWQMVENFFLSCLRGEKTAVFSEGELLLERDGDKYVKATMYNAGNGVICRGITGGRYFDAKTPIVWSGLKPDCFYYLYVSTTDKTFDDPSDFDSTSSEVSLLSENQALVATVDLRGDTYEVDRFPPGKNCPTMLQRHIEDNVDPHGEILHQKNISVKNRLDAHSATIGDLRTESLIVGGVEVRFDGKRYRTEVNDVDVPPGKTMFNGDLKDGRIVFAQCLDPNVVFSISNGVLSAENNTGKKISTTMMLTIE